MQKAERKKRHCERWNFRPETQDLHNTRSTGPWPSRTACCQSKKKWKRVIPGF